jgi:plasmid stability protein
VFGGLACAIRELDLYRWTQADRSVRPTFFACAINAISAIIDGMASITIRKLAETTKRKLRMRAARHGRSMEHEAREILQSALTRTDEEPEDIGQAIRNIFGPLGGVELDIPPRGPIRDPQIR